MQYALFLLQLEVCCGMYPCGAPTASRITWNIRLLYNVISSCLLIWYNDNVVKLRVVVTLTAYTDICLYRRCLISFFFPL
jgi:hypothetical protein